MIRVIPPVGFRVRSNGSLGSGVVPASSITIVVNLVKVRVGVKVRVKIKVRVRVKVRVSVRVTRVSPSVSP
jgi:hypothetical protein